MTCKPLEIIRLTALLPPPPTPITLILADSIGEKEHLSRIGLGFESLLRFEKPTPDLLIPVLAETQLLRNEWDIDFARNEEDEEEIVSSLSCANGIIAIFDLLPLISKRKER